MPKKRVILELGSGNDLHGSDYTKAALRAVQDALHHSSLAFIRSLKIDKSKLEVDVTDAVRNAFIQNGELAIVGRESAGSPHSKHERGGKSE